MAAIAAGLVKILSESLYIYFMVESMPVTIFYTHFNVTDNIVIEL